MHFGVRCRALFQQKDREPEPQPKELSGRVSQWLAVSRGTEPPGLAVANSDQRLLLGGGGEGGVQGVK